MKLEFREIHRKWKNTDNQILIHFLIRLYEKPEAGKKLLQGSIVRIYLTSTADGRWAVRGLVHAVPKSKTPNELHNTGR